MRSTFIACASYNGLSDADIVKRTGHKRIESLQSYKAALEPSLVAQKKARQFHSILHSLTANANRLPFASNVLLFDTNNSTPSALFDTNNADLISVLSVYNNGFLGVMQNFR